MNLSALKNRNALKLLFKLLFACAILYWLILEKKLDYGILVQSLKHPVAWGLCVILMITQIILSAIRWKIILETKTIKISLLNMIRIQWIGQLFSAILPGGVTGDLVKIGYISNFDKNISKKFLLLSIFIDRLAGVTSLLIIAGFSSVIFFKDLVALNPQLKSIISINLILFICSFVIVILFLLNKKVQHRIITYISFHKIKSILETIWSFSSYKKEMIFAILISAIGHFMSIGWILVASATPGN